MQKLINVANSAKIQIPCHYQQDFFFFAGLNRLKKSVETFKKKNETNVDSLQNNLEQSLESLTSKLSNFESRHQDNVSHLDHLKQCLSKKLLK